MLAAASADSTANGAGREVNGASRGRNFFGTNLARVAFGAYALAARLLARAFPAADRACMPHRAHRLVVLARAADICTIARAYLLDHYAISERNLLGFRIAGAVACRTALVTMSVLRTSFILLARLALEIRVAHAAEGRAITDTLGWARTHIAGRVLWALFLRATRVASVEKRTNTPRRFDLAVARAHTGTFFRCRGIYRTLALLLAARASIAIFTLAFYNEALEHRATQ